jgi:hypothetical protein
MEKYRNDLPANIVDDYINIMETLKNHIFTCYLIFSCIYEAKENKYDLCLFWQVIEGYSYFLRKYMNLCFI